MSYIKRPDIRTRKHRKNLRNSHSTGSTDSPTTKNSNTSSSGVLNNTSSGNEQNGFINLSVDNNSIELKKDGNKPEKEAAVKVKEEADEEQNKIETEEKCIRLLIDCSNTGIYIGKGGSNINKIRETSGAEIALQDRRLRFAGEEIKRILKITGTTKKIRCAIIQIIEYQMAEYIVSKKDGKDWCELTVLSKPGLPNWLHNHKNITIKTYDNWELIRVSHKPVYGNEFVDLVMKVFNVANTDINEKLLETHSKKKNKKKKSKKKTKARNHQESSKNGSNHGGNSIKNNSSSNHDTQNNSDDGKHKTTCEFNIRGTCTFYSESPITNNKQILYFTDV